MDIEQAKEICDKEEEVQPLTLEEALNIVKE